VHHHVLNIQDWGQKGAFARWVRQNMSALWSSVAESDGSVDWGTTDPGMLLGFGVTDRGPRKRGLMHAVCGCKAYTHALMVPGYMSLTACKRREHGQTPTAPEGERERPSLSPQTPLLVTLSHPPPPPVVSK